MNMLFSLAIEYLTGYAVAMDSANRGKAEWPPHPARVFMALAAAHFESEGAPGLKRAEREALEWLAALAPPAMAVPAHTEREIRTVYVPVNDQSGADAIVQRSRQPRTFPRVHLGDELLRLTWHASEKSFAEHQAALESVCRNVTRIGHSSSLVWVRVERGEAVKSTLVPDEEASENLLRVTQAGAVQRLEEAFGLAEQEEFIELHSQVDTAKGKPRKVLQESLNQRFPRGQPVSRRPVFSISHGYRQVAPASAAVAESAFDPNFIVLRASDDASGFFGLESTAQITNALRNVIMRNSKVQPAPAWVSGHEANGAKLESGSHMALVPLAFVGGRHGDGHLMGVGILIPRDVPYRERSKALSSVLSGGPTNEPRPLPLVIGRAGKWNVERETSLSPRATLRPSTYTGPSRSWASVTPVVLDRMPKTDRVENPIRWREEVAGIIARACENAKLPQPISVRVEKTPFFRGSLRAMPGQGGFPQLRAGRFQVHIQIDFDREVAGPVLIGAGRFRGYGLMRPWANAEGQ